MTKIHVLERDVAVYAQNDEDFICITDIARYKDPDGTDDLIRSWIRNRNTIEFLGIWEQLNNPDFNPIEFDGFRKQAGLNSLTLTPILCLCRPGKTPIDCNVAKYGLPIPVVKTPFIPETLSHFPKTWSLQKGGRGKSGTIEPYTGSDFPPHIMGLRHGTLRRSSPP